MALSENELSILAGLEEQLSSDQKFVSSMRETKSSVMGTSRNIIFGVLVIAAGMGTIVAGASFGLVILGIFGFVVMIAGGVLCTHGDRQVSSPNGSGPSDSQKSDFMKKLEDRWEKRREEEQRRNQM